MTKQTAITSCAILAMTAFLILPSLADNIAVTADAAKVQTSNLSGTNVYVESFDGATTGDSGTTTLTWYQAGTSGPTVGTFTSTAAQSATSTGGTAATTPGFEIRPADDYSGAGGTGNYLAVGSETEVITGKGKNAVDNYTYASTLTLTTPEDYVGVWVGALDNANTITIYDGTTVLESLSASQISAIIGSNSAYNGNPNAAFLNADDTEQFAYINIYDNTGADITSVVFQEGTTANTDYTGAGFELDNVVVAQNFITSGGPTGTPISGSVVPEPGTVASMVIGIASLAGLGLRRRYRNGLTS